MKPNRDVSIDLLRGWAIIFMIISHSIFFRYGLGNGFFNMLIHLSESFCYITFLFTYGVGLYYSTISSTWNHARLVKQVNRLAQLLVMYYAVAILSTWSSFSLSLWNMHLLMSQAWKVISFQSYPGFTEYLPSFVIFSALFLLWRQAALTKLLSWFSGRNFIWTISIGLTVHFVANWAVHSFAHDVPAWLRMFIGSVTTFDFPIAQYLPVVLIGIWAAHQIIMQKNLAELTLVKTAYYALLANLIVKYTFHFTHSLGWIMPWVNTFLRWPPSFSFLLNGLSYTFLFWLLSRWLLRHSWTLYISRVLVYIGRRSMGFLVYHLVVLFSMKILALPLFSVLQLGLFFIIIPTSYFIGESVFMYYKNRTGQV